MTTDSLTKEEILARMAELSGPKYYSCATEDVMKGLRKELFNLEHPEFADQA